jgi:type II secretory pathway pseudopilin PulG
MTPNPYESPKNLQASRIARKGNSFSLLTMLVVVGMVVVLTALMLPSIRWAPDSRGRTKCMNNLKNITLALISYTERHNAFPPAYTVDANGNRLHSWRTLILPYLDQQALYESIDLSKPWNDPANAKAFGKELDVYSCRAAKLSHGLTTYLGNAAADGCFTGERPRPVSEKTYPHHNTVLVVEVASSHAVHWMAPEDADESILLNFGSGNKSAHIGVVGAGFVDGTVRILSVDLDSHVRRTLISASGSDEISEKDF